MLESLMHKNASILFIYLFPFFLRGWNHLQAVLLLFHFNTSIRANLILLPFRTLHSDTGASASPAWCPGGRQHSTTSGFTKALRLFNNLGIIGWVMQHLLTSLWKMWHSTCCLYRYSVPPVPYLCVIYKEAHTSGFFGGFFVQIYSFYCCATVFKTISAFGCEDGSPILHECCIYFIGQSKGCYF